MNSLRIATWMRPSDDAWFPKIFARYPDALLLNERTESFDFATADALLLTGGQDISENYLQQPIPNPAHIEDAKPDRDAWDFPALKLAMEKTLPILAICRGTQILNVALGGTLHLDVDGHDLPTQKDSNCQPLRYASGVAAPFYYEKVNSSHHQALDEVANDLEVEAWHAEDGIIEQVRLKNYPYAFGTQYHPERHPIYFPLFDSFVEATRISKAARESQKGM